MYILALHFLDGPLQKKLRILAIKHPLVSLARSQLSHSMISTDLSGEQEVKTRWSSKRTKSEASTHDGHCSCV